MELSQGQLDDAIRDQLMPKWRLGRADPASSSGSASGSSSSPVPGSSQFLAKQLSDQIDKDGPQVVEVNGTRVIFGTCEIGNLAPAYQLFASYNYSCPIGYYCPNVNSSQPYSVPQMCQSSPACLLTRLNGYPCYNSKYEPQICQPGSYCPSYRQMLDCPPGFYCPLGSSQPIKCSAMASCSGNAVHEQYWGGLFAALILDAFLLGVFYLVKRKHRKTALKKRLRRENQHAQNYFGASEALAKKQEATNIAANEHTILTTASGTPPESKLASPQVRAASPEMMRGRQATSPLAFSETGVSPLRAASQSTSPIKRSESKSSLRGLRRIASNTLLSKSRSRGDLALDAAQGNIDSAGSPREPASTNMDERTTGITRSESADSFVLNPADLKMSESMLSLASLAADDGAASINDDADAHFARGGLIATDSTNNLLEDVKLSDLQSNDNDLEDDGNEEPDSNDISALLEGLNRGRQGRQLKLDFKFRDLSITLPDGKTILNNVTGRARAGRVTAIMGPSGSGKTTLMNCLMGKISRTSGDLLINNLSATGTSHGQVVGYVPQQDVLLPEMTVKESVLYSARVRLPRDWSTQETKVFVDAILGALDLKHVADTLVGDETTRGVSGGQKKRCNIGLELASSPLALFLDEPTSGLDSTSALKVAKILQKLARLGLTIVTVIHQPRYEIFQCIDDLIMMAPGGIVAYSGAQKDVINYFENLAFTFGQFQNPADVLLDILSAKGTLSPTKDLTHLIPPAERKMRSHRKGLSYDIRHVTAAWSAHTEAMGMGREHISKSSMLPNDIARLQEEVNKLTKIRGARVWTQVWLVHNRAMIQAIRRIDSFVIDLLSSGLAGLIIGLIAANIGFSELYHGSFKDDGLMVSPAPFELMVPLYCLMLSLSIALVSSAAAARLLSDERLVFTREFNAGHSPLAYFIGKNILGIYRITLLALHYGSFIQFMTSPIAPFSATYSAIFCWYFGVWGVAQVISLLSKKENAPMTSVLGALGFSVLTGMGPNLKSAFAGIISLSYSRWLAEALFNMEVTPYAKIYMIEFSAQIYGYTLGRFSFDIGIAFIIGLSLRVLAFFIMWNNKRRSR